MLAFFKVRPPECIDSRKAHLLGGYFNHERTSHASQIDLLPIESFGALISAAIWTWILCRNLVGLLAGWIYPLFCLCHPPTLRYTHAIRESKRERDIRLQHSADIFTRKNALRLQAIQPRIKVFSYHNMKSAVDPRSKRVVRRLVCEDWTEFYKLEDPKHFGEIQRWCSIFFNEMYVAAFVFVVFCCAASFAAALSLAFCILQVVALPRFFFIKILLRPRPGQWLTDYILTTLRCCAASCTAVYAKARCTSVSTRVHDSSLAKYVVASTNTHE